MKRLTITTLAAFGILVGTLPLARAAGTSCTTVIATGATIDGNLTVPASATCTLENVTVTGNVTVGRGATLLVETGTGQAVTIGGNVQAAQCQKVFLAAPPGMISVGGNVRIENCTQVVSYNGPNLTISGNFLCNDNSGPCAASQVSVSGNLQFNNNTGVTGTSTAIVVENVVYGNVQVNNNTSSQFGAIVQNNDVYGNVQVNNNVGNSNPSEGDTRVSGNTISGNLQCAGNTPGVIDLGPKNTISGNKRGQCAGF